MSWNGPTEAHPSPIPNHTPSLPTVQFKVESALPFSVCLCVYVCVYECVMSTHVYVHILGALTEIGATLSVRVEVWSVAMYCNVDFALEVLGLLVNSLSYRLLLCRPCFLF